MGDASFSEIPTGSEVNDSASLVVTFDRWYRNVLPAFRSFPACRESVESVKIMGLVDGKQEFVCPQWPSD